MDKFEYTTLKEFNSDLEFNKICSEKFWKLPERDRKLILDRYAKCTVRNGNISNRRFNINYHRAMVNRKK